MRQLLFILAVIAVLEPWAPAFALFTGNSDFFFTGDPVMIPVCWKNANDSDVNNIAARRELQEAIESQWQRFARVNFTHFGPCETAPNVRRIEVRFDSSKGGGQCGWTEDTQATKDCWIGAACVSGGNATCIRGVIIHEIGHALGYYHEEERLDYDHTVFWSGAMPEPDCASQNWCAPDNPNAETCPNQIRYGGYDPNSIMAYCQPDQELSPNDIFAHQHVYGFRMPGMIMSPRGSCLSVNFAIDNFTFVWDCDEAAGQEWRRLLDGHIQSMQYASKVLGYSGAGANGKRVEAVNWWSDKAKEWDLVRTEVRGFAGKCLTLLDGDTSNGNAVVMAECDNSLSQRWRISRKGEIMYAGYSGPGLINIFSLKCVTVAGGGTADGTTLEIRTCDGSASQQFSFTNNNIKQGGKCVDVPAWLDADYWPYGEVGIDTNRNLPRDGAQLQLWDCLSEQFNQKFWFSGFLRTRYEGRCLDLENGNSNNGTRIQVWDCLYNDNQRWEIFF